MTPSVVVSNCGVTINSGPDFKFKDAVDTLQCKALSEYRDLSILDQSEQAEPTQRQQSTSSQLSEQYMPYERLGMVMTSGVFGKHAICALNAPFPGEPKSFIVRGSSGLPSLRARLPEGTLIDNGRWYYEVKILRLHRKRSVSSAVASGAGDSGEQGDGDSDEKDDSNGRPQSNRPTRLVVGFSDDIYFGNCTGWVGVGDDRHSWGLAMDTEHGVHARHRISPTNPPQYQRLEFQHNDDQDEENRTPFSKGDKVQYRVSGRQGYKAGIVEKGLDDSDMYTIKESDDVESAKQVPARFVENAEFVEYSVKAGEMHWPYNGTGSGFAVDDVIGCAVDVEQQRIMFYHNGVQIHTVDTEADGEERTPFAFTDAASIRGFQPCISVGDAFRVACNFGPQPFSNEGAGPPDDYRWISDWTPESRLIEQEDSGSSDETKRAESIDLARQQLTALPPRNLDELPKTIDRDKTSKDMRDRLQQIWCPKSDHADVDISRLPVSEHDLQERNALLYVLEGVFAPPRDMNDQSSTRESLLRIESMKRSPRMRTESIKRLEGVGRSVTKLSANNCQLSPDAQGPYGLGDFLEEAHTGRNPPVPIFHSGLLILELVGNRLMESDVKIICDTARACTQLTSLDLSQNEIGSGGASLLTDLLVDLPKLKFLSLASNAIDSSGCMDMGLNWLRYAIELTSLDISGNAVSAPGLAVLLEAISSEHNIVALKANAMSAGPAGAEVFAQFVHSYSKLTELDVSANDFGPAAGAIALALVETSYNIRKLKISENNFGDGAGLEKLIHLIKAANVSGECSNLFHIDITNVCVGNVGADKIAEAMNLCALHSFTMKTDGMMSTAKQVDLVFAMRHVGLYSLDFGNLVQVFPDEGDVEPGRSVAKFFSRPLSYSVEQSYDTMARTLIRRRNGFAKAENFVRIDTMDDYVTPDDAMESLRIAIKMHTSSARHLAFLMIGKDGQDGIAYTTREGLKCYNPPNELVKDVTVETAA
eukprot:COSAG06_NODE_85_length_25072_cov_62.049453_12_plen_989_part_00